MKYIKTEHLKILLELANDKIKRSDILQIEQAQKEKKLILDELKKRDINGFNY